MIEISDEVKAIWKAAHEIPAYADVDMLAIIDFARDQLAARLKLEFTEDHLGCNNNAPPFICDDPTHYWTDADWQREAERLLRGKP